MYVNFLIRLDAVKLPRSESSNRGLPFGEIGKCFTWQTKLHTKRARKWGVGYVIIFMYVNFFIRLDAVKIPRSESSNRGLPCGEIGKCFTWQAKLHAKRARKCDLFHLQQTFSLQSPRINFVWSDMASTPQLQSSWRWPQWCYLGTAGAMVTTPPPLNAIWCDNLIQDLPHVFMLCIMTINIFWIWIWIWSYLFQ